jgi:hypothetical protein
MKRKDRVGKRRALVAAGEIGWLETDTTPAEWDGHWFHRRLQARQLHPVCQVSYSRLALAASSDLGAIRLTIDSRLVAIPAEGYAFRTGRGEELFDKHIVELKFRRHLPAVFRELTRRFLLTPEPVSKYRRAAEVLGLAEEHSLCAIC